MQLRAGNRRIQLTPTTDFKYVYLRVLKFL